MYALIGNVGLIHLTHFLWSGDRPIRTTAARFLLKSRHTFDVVLYHVAINKSPSLAYGLSSYLIPSSKMQLWSTYLIPSGLYVGWRVLVVLIFTHHMMAYCRWIRERSPYPGIPAFSSMYALFRNMGVIHLAHFLLSGSRLIGTPTP